MSRIDPGQRKIARTLSGKTVCRVTIVNVGASNSDPDVDCSEPEILFTDGTILRFIATEKDSGDGYGIDLVLVSP